jgi:hypothetical protein
MDAGRRPAPVIDRDYKHDICDFRVLTEALLV